MIQSLPVISAVTRRSSRHAIAALAATAALCSCTYRFQRTQDVQPGDVVGRALHADGGGDAGFARITVDGANLVRRANNDGSFVIRGLSEGTWLLRFQEDQNGDGRLDRAGVRAVSLKSFTAPGTTGAQLSSVLLGNVPLGGVVTVSGSAARDDGAPPSDNARAFVVRGAADLSPEELAGASPASLAGTDGVAEATSGVGPDGAFVLPDIAPGTFHLVAFDPGDGEHPPAMSAPVAVTAAAGGATDAGTVRLVPASGTRSVRVTTALTGETSGASGAAATVKLVRIGGSPARPGDVLASLDTTLAAAMDLEVPLGAFDVYVDSAPDAPEFHGALLGQLAYSGPEVLQWGLLTIQSADPCNPIGDVDRDQDGKVGLPLQSLAPELWEQCLGPCTVSGAALAQATCDAGGQRYDCDDDGDGQPDVLEPACYGLCAGADLDEDGRCDRSQGTVDPCSPSCEPADAGVVVDAGPQDAGFEDAGQPPVRLGCSQPGAVPADGVVAGTLAPDGADDVDGCFDLLAPDAIFSFNVPPDGLATLNASTAGSTFDTVLSVYQGVCDPQSALGCNDDTGGPQSLVTAADVPAGDVFFVVEGYRGATGDYRLEVSGTYALGAACDPDRTSLVCPGGACGPDGNGGFVCLPPRDCADGVDADGDGQADEDSCVQAPVVTCPDDVVVTVLNPATLSASATDDVLVASRRWSIVQAPTGSTVALEGGTSDDVSFTPVLVGDYRLRYVAADDAGQLSACEVKVTATTDDALRVELLWNLDVTTGDDTDLDLHLLHDDAIAGGVGWFDNGLDCHFANCRAGGLSWNFNALAVDPSPSLDVDDRDGRGPENINIKSPEDLTYRIGVHYFADNAFGPSTALVNVFCFGDLAQSIVSPAPLTTDPSDPAQNDFWKVADVTIDNASSSCTVTPLGDVVTTAQARLAP